jgi:MFS family permease
VHLAIVLNKVFLPQDTGYEHILRPMTFLMPLCVRPIGALVWGYVGDNMGRKATVVITTIMMSVSCVIMANVPTYAQIGISAAWIVTVCRVIQGLSSMGEIVGAEIYLTETVEIPARYPVVGLIGVLLFGLVRVLLW